MTAKQAAQSVAQNAKQAVQGSWHWAKTSSYRSAALFVAGGVAVVLGAKWLEGADGATLYGYAAAGWGAFQWLVERTAKRTGTEMKAGLPEQVAAAIWKEFGTQQEQIARGDEEHRECWSKHEATDESVKAISGRVAAIEEAHEVTAGKVSTLWGLQKGLGS